MRRIFVQWGLPDRIRVDNGAPWSTWSDLPPALALWWIGLGIYPLWNHPHTPKENAFVERSNGLVATWAEPGSCAGMTVWEEKLEWVSQTQRERYPSIQGKSRMEAFPELLTPRRAYSPATEEQHWDVHRVHEYLAQGRWPRYVSKIGQITFYGKAYRVGRAYVKQQVWLRFDPVTAEWVVQEDDGTEIIRHQAEQVTKERICALDVAQARPPSIKKKRQNIVSHPAA
jgi:hypothetical protein